MPPPAAAASRDGDLQLVQDALAYSDRSHHSLSAGWSRHLRPLASSVRVQRCERGHCIYRQGDGGQSPSYYIVRRGTVRTQKQHGRRCAPGRCCAKLNQSSS
eukprot:SAG22_NODE_11029_length_504_cov_1.148148_1_plen_101_part_10